MFCARNRNTAALVLRELTRLFSMIIFLPSTLALALTGTFYRRRCVKGRLSLVLTCGLLEVEGQIWSNFGHDGDGSPKDSYTPLPFTPVFRLRYAFQLLQTAQVPNT